MRILKQYKKQNIFMTLFMISTFFHGPVRAAEVTSLGVKKITQMNFIYTQAESEDLKALGDRRLIIKHSMDLLKTLGLAKNSDPQFMRIELNQMRLAAQSTDEEVHKMTENLDFILELTTEKALKSAQALNIGKGQMWMFSNKDAVMTAFMVPSGKRIIKLQLLLDKFNLQNQGAETRVLTALIRYIYGPVLSYVRDQRNNPQRTEFIPLQASVKKESENSAHHKVIEVLKNLIADPFPLLGTRSLEFSMALSPDNLKQALEEEQSHSAKYSQCAPTIARIGVSTNL